MSVQAALALDLVLANLSGNMSLLCSYADYYMHEMEVNRPMAIGHVQSSVPAE